VKYSLSTKRRTDAGLETMTVRWDHKPTEEQAEAARIENYKGRKLQPGEALRARKIGRVLIILNTGPPTWWFPRFQFTKAKGLGVRGGWLRAALDISYNTKKEG
jgi:hypothetical protein